MSIDILVSVPATCANLGPGFDTLGVAIGLRNEFRIKSAKFNSISLKGEGESIPKFKSDNMFVHIFYEILDKVGAKKENFRFSFLNKIPISRGLGSSSAVIIGAISAAFAAARLEINKESILYEALRYEPHPDNITPACMGGFNVCMLNNKRVRFIKHNMPEYLKAVIVVPQKPISTSHSRTLLPKSYSKKNAIFNLSRSSLLTAAIILQKWDLLKEASEDRFHQEIRMKQLPELFEVQKVALSNGALMSTLSGSGSSMFQLAYKDDAQKLADRLKDRFSEFGVYVFDFDNDGVIVK